MALLFISAAARGYAQGSEEQDSTGLPGDHFSLQGALALFKTAGSPQEFEKLLNTEENNVNNLDLNGDGEVDYIRVIDRKSGNAHAFVLQVPVSGSESQDIAVIELEKTGADSAVIQIIGDQDIFGEQTIVEPDGGGEDSEEIEDEGGGKGPCILESSMPAPMMPRLVINVWGWPGVRFVYAPRYVAWVSPWRWRAFPTWWHPWHPLAWRVFHPFRVHYRAGFVVARSNRLVVAHRAYLPARRTSVVVRTRYQGPVRHYRVTRTTRVNVRPGGVMARTQVRPGGVKPRTKVRRGRR
jgi:hypothetical protein